MKNIYSFLKYIVLNCNSRAGWILRVSMILMMLLSGLNQKVAAQGGTAMTEGTKSSMLDKYNKAAQPLLFMENRGQITDQYGSLRNDVLFMAKSKGFKVAVNGNGLSYQFDKINGVLDLSNRKKMQTAGQDMADDATTESYRVDLALVGANPHPQVERLSKNAYTESFYNLLHAPEGIMGVAAYEKLILKEVYPGIDWVIYTHEGSMKYDFIVHPGADPSLIKMKYDGAKTMTLQKDGSLKVVTPLGEITEQAPISFSGKAEVPSRFTLQDDVLSFEVPEYDRSQTLTIDPSLLWGTYYGGANDENGTSVALDGSGNVYLAGFTPSNSDISSGGHQNAYGGMNDAFLVKFNAAGVRQWATYYGGVSADYGSSVAVDGSGNVYMAGQTQSNSNIASGGHQNSPGGVEDAFLVKFNSAGTRLWGTYYGGTGRDFGGTSVAVDGSGNVYMSGETESATGIASGGHDNTFTGNRDAFLVKFNSGGTRQWATYYGGATNSSYGNSVAVDGSNNVYMAGQTESAVDIASGGHDDILDGLSDLFLVKFNSGGTRLWATYYGGTSYEDGGSVDVDGSNNVYLAGTTRGSTTDIASGGHQNTLAGNDDAFLVKFNSAGVRQWGTYYGGPGEEEQAYANVTVDGAGNVYLAGATLSTTGIAYNGYQNTFAGGFADAFLVKFTAAGTRLWGTYYGGAGADYGASVVVEGSGNIYLAGVSSSVTGIAFGGHQNTNGGGLGGYDAFLAKFSPSDFVTKWTFPSAATSITFNALTAGGAVNYTWSASPSGNSGSGSFSMAVAGSVTLTGLTIAAGDVVTLTMESQNLRRFYINNGADKDRLTDVSQWGDVPWTNMATAFLGCVNLQVTATDVPNLSGVTNMNGMFYECTVLNGPTNIGSWNMATITNMAAMFRSAAAFNQNIGSWNTANVTDMGSMFQEAAAFNQNIGGWNTAAVTAMGDLVLNATAFNQNLGNWTLNPAVSMTSMLGNSGMDCNNYSATLNGWAANNPTVTGRTLGATGRQYGTNAVTARNTLTTTRGWTITGDSPSGGGCFTSGDFVTQWTFPAAATQIRFNAQTAGGAVSYTWSASPSGNSGSGTFTRAVAGAVTLSGLTIVAGDVVTLTMTPSNLRRFYINGGADQLRLTDVSRWGDVPWSSMFTAFLGCENLQVTATDVPNLAGVTDMQAMFYGCTILNGPANIGTWNTSAVTNMSTVFRSAAAFNQNIGSWNTAAVTSMNSMFQEAAAFNQNIGGWNTAAVTDMGDMFFSATAFNQNIGSWTLNSGVSMLNMLSNSGMDCNNYSATLIGWAANNPTVTGRSSGATGRQYGTNAVAARTTLDVTRTWTITGDTPSGTVCVACNGSLVGNITAQTNVLCFGQSTGAVTVVGSGGTAPYMYSFNGGAYQSSGTFSSLAAGAYTVTVRDAALCTSTVNGTLTQPAAALVVTPSLTQPQCFAFGGITLAVSGGTAPYTFDWADISGTNNVQNRSGLAAGNYSVTVTDANGCTVASGILTLDAPTSCGPVTVCQNDLADVFSVAPHPDNSPYTWTVPMGALITSGQGTPSITVNWTGATPGTGQVCVVALNVCGTSAQTCQDVNIVAPPAPNTMASPTCAGGDIQLFASGGGTYNWSGPNGFTSASANPIITNANAGTHNGTYSVTVTNTAGCSATGTVAVTVSAPPQLSVVSTNNATCGQANGVVNLTVTSGTPAFTYAWSNGAVTEDLNNVLSGNYRVTVTDAAGCTASLGASIGDTPGPILTEMHTNVSCFGGSNGAINLSITGGTPPQSILWFNGSTMEDQSGLAAGSYGVTVTDNSGCVAALMVAITQPDAITTDFTKVDVNCFGGATGSIDLIVAGGTGVYSYSWTKNGSAFGGNTQDLPSLGFGVYSVTVTDANSCTATTAVTISQPAVGLNATSAVTNVSCNGATDGQVILTVTGGSLPYSYAWTGPSGFTATTQNIIGRVAGTYNVTVTDGKGCTFPLTGIMITQPALLAVSSAIPDDVNCFGGADGSINATIAGGTMPYTYLWSNGSVAQDPSGLSAGSYTLTVTDVNGCTAVSGNIAVAQPAAPLAIQPTVVDVNCFGGLTGSINLTVTGGTGVYSYSWTKDGSPYGGNTQNLSGLTKGIYAVTVTDANSCTASRSIIIAQPDDPLNVTPAIVNVSCNGGTNGQIFLALSVGTAPYMYAWTGPNGFTATTQAINGLLAGAYNVTVTDGKGCTFPLTGITISQPAALDILSATIAGISCSGGANGGIVTLVSGGTMPYTYLWSNGSTTQNLSGLAAGDYTLTVTDDKGCTAATGNLTISQPAAALAATPTVTNAACNGASTGRISLAVSGGTPGYTYLWSNGAATQDIMDVPAGNYAVTITDLNLCTLVTTASVDQPAAITASEFITPAVCNGGNSGAINLVVTGGTGAYTFAWSNGLPATEDQTGLSAGSYTVSITDANLCTYMETFTVSQPVLLTATGVEDNANCFGVSDGSINLTVAGGTAPFTYAWSNGANTEDVSGLAAGSYMVTVTDFNLCTANQSFTIAEPNVLAFTSAVIPNCAAQSNGSVALTISGGTGPFTYNWTGAGSGTNPRTNLAAGTYNVTVTDAGGCMATSSFTLVPLSVVVTGFDRNCLAENGQVFAAATGGLMPYTYTWSNSAMTDNISNLNSGVFSVTVTAGTCTATGQTTLLAPACQPPVAVDEQFTILVNTPVSGSVRINDTDPVFATNTLTIEPITTLDPSIGVIVWDPSDNGNFVFTPATNFIGVVTILYDVCNTIALCDGGILTIRINSTNAQNDINQTPINTTVNGNVLTNDNDPQGNAQTVTAALADTDGDGSVDDNLPLATATTIYGLNNANVLVVAGQVTLATNGTYTYTPALNFTGNAPFAYTITDNSTPAASDAATVNIEVIPASVGGVNEPPIANDDTNTTEQDVNVSGNVLPNDSDPDGNVIMVTSALADTNGDGLASENLPLGASTFVYGTNVGGNLVLAGEITLNSNGSYTFNPQPTFTGEVPVQYTISDPGGLMDNAVLTITVIPNLGNVTVANDDANSSPQGVVQTGNILMNDFDPEGNAQTVTGAVNSANSALVVNGVTANALPSGGTLVLFSNGAYTYTPASGFTGTEIIRYTVTDNGSPVATDMATLYLTTLPINNTLAQNDINQTPVNIAVSGNVLTNDSDPQGNTQTVTSALADTDGDGSVDDPLTLGSNITVYGVNNANTVVIAGTVTLNSNGAYTYTPATNYQGTVPFAYTITDNNPSPATANATVAIEVIPVSVPGVNEPPVANDDTNTTEQDVNVSGFVLPNDDDPDGDVITVTSSLADTDGDGQVDDPLTLSTPTSVSGINASGMTVPAGTIILNPNGSYTFDPLPAYTGTVRVQYTISDPLGLTDNAILAITIIPNLGNSTFANDDANTGPLGVSQTGNLLINDFDPEGNAQTVTGAVNSANSALVVNGVTANALPSGGTLVLFSNGAYTYTPALGFAGTEIIRYTVTDNGSPLATDVATLYLTTLPINNTYAQNDINATPINVTATGNVLTNDNDPQGNTQTVTSALADTDGDGSVDDPLTVASPSPITIYGTNNTNMVVVAGQVTLNSNGTYIYLPATNFTGGVPFAYTVTDNNASPATDQATVSIQVIPTPATTPNDPPLAQNDTKTTERDVNVGGNVMDNDSDPDGDVITVTAALVDTDGDGLVNDPLTLGVSIPVYGKNVGGITVFAGNLILNSNGTFIFDPTPTFLGTVPVDYTIADPDGLTDGANLTIRVTENEGNVTYANDDVNTGLINIVQIGNVLTNDTDPEGNTQTVTGATNSNNTAITIGLATTLPSGGQFTLNANGTYTYTPATNFVGTEQVVYTVTDNGSPVATDRATLYLTTLPLIISNSPPVANNDSGSTPEDTPITVNVLSNDTDPDNNINPGSVTIVTPPANGMVMVNPLTGQVTYTPNANFNGVNTFTYSVCDTGSPVYCDDAVVTITITPSNDPPVAVNDAATTPEDTPVTFPVTANDTDVDGAINPATLDLNPSTAGVQTTFTVVGQGTFVANPVTGEVTFTPVLNFNGTTTPITYNVCDNGTPLPAQCDDATITVTVTPVNDPPVAVNDVANTPEDTPVTFSVTGNDTDVDGAINPSTLDLNPSTAGVQTTFTVAGQGTFVANPVTGEVTFTPVLNFNGTTTPITYNVCDNGTPLPALCDDATITVIISSVNNPPVAVNDAATTPEDTPVTFPVTDNDTDVDGTINPATLDLDPLSAGVQTTFTVVGQGTFVANPMNGNVTFTPVANYNGTTTPITYVVCDNGVPALCDDATITVTVTPANDPPVAVNDVATTPEDTPVTFPVTANDTDVDGAINPATLDLNPSTAGVQTTFTVAGQGTFVANPVTGEVTFTPVLNFNGTTTPITYNVCDNGTPLPAQCDDATITVTVTPVNDPPVAANDVANTPEDTPVTFSVTGNDTDVDGAINPSTLDLNPSTAGVQTTFTVAGQGTFVANPVTGEVTFTPVLNFNGTTTPITYNVCDNGTPLPALCDDATITVIINSVNNPPVAVNDAATTPEDTPVTFPVTDNDTDVDGAINPATLDLNPSTAGVQTTFTVVGQGTFVANPVTGEVTFTPVANYNGTTTPITYVVCDNGVPALCDDATITVTVTPANDPPVAVNDAATTPEDSPVTFPVTSNDTDIDGAINPATLDLDPTTVGVQTTFTVAGQGTFVANPANGNVTFTPVSNYNGTTTPITYNVCDNGTPLPALCDDATITVTVTPVNDPPVAVNDVATTPEDSPVTFPVTGNDTDTDGAINPATLDLDPATVGVQTTFTVVGQGTFVANPVTGEVTFTPVANYTGTTTPITYNVCDNGTPMPAQCDDATITVTVTPANDPPVAVNDAATTPEDSPVTFPVTSNDTDIDGAINPATLDLDPTTVGVQTTFTVAGQGTFVANPANGNVTFTPVSNYNGTTTPITYNVCDNGTPLPALCDDATITVTVTPVNDPPIAVNDVATTPEDSPVTFPVTGNDTDTDGAINPTTLDLDPATVGVQTTFTVAGQGTYVANPVNGNVTFTPVSNFSGLTTPVLYSVCDNGTPLPALCSQATITVNVIPDINAKLKLKVMLQGALFGTSNGLMRDDLRAGGYLPLTEPYTAFANTRLQHRGGGGGETTTAAVLAANAGTPNAIVDWVFVELRSTTDSANVLITRSALLQRDGDVVSATDGTSMLVFTGIVGQAYFVSVKHRNHLGAMTAGRVVMNNDSTLVDFITATNAQVYDRPGNINYNGMEQVTFQTKRALWAGNANMNTKVKYQGTSSDNTILLAQVLGYPTNILGSYNYNLAFGYFNGDINMDGKVKYQGPTNDATFIFSNVIGLYNTLNTIGLYNYDLFLEQTPN